MPENSIFVWSAFRGSLRPGVSRERRQGWLHAIFQPDHNAAAICFRFFLQQESAVEPKDNQLNRSSQVAKSRPGAGVYGEAEAQPELLEVPLRC